MKKGMIPVADFAQTLNVSPAQITNMKSTGILSGDIFEKQGRRNYIHQPSAMKALKVAPMGTRGRIPAWVHIVGNKEGIKKAKMAEKAAAAASEKKAAKSASKPVKSSKKNTKVAAAA